MKSIPKKNYFIFLGICVVTCLAVIFFINRVNFIEKSGKSPLSGILSEISNENMLLNLESYSLENPSFILYISNNDTLFEEEFKDFIISNNVTKNIVFLNGWGRLNIDFLKDFQNNLFDEKMKNISISALKQSNLYFFKSGKVVDLLYYEAHDIGINDVKVFIESVEGDGND